jgi:hypothetical protein
MFAIKKTTKTGECRAMRCTMKSGDLLCEKHAIEWKAAGCPPLVRDLSLAPRGDSLATLEPTRVEMEAERHRAQEALAIIAALPVETEEDRAFIAQCINQATAEVKRLEEKRKGVVAPLNQVVKTVNGWFSPAVEFYSQAKALLSNKLAERIKRLESERTAALAEIQAGGGEASPEAFLVAHASASAPAGTTVRRRLKWRVTDLSKVPDTCLTTIINEGAVDGIVAEYGLKTNIPGIEVYEDITVGAGRGA